MLFRESLNPERKFSIVIPLVFTAILGGTIGVLELAVVLSPQASFVSNPQAMLAQPPAPGETPNDPKEADLQCPEESADKKYGGERKPKTYLENNRTITNLSWQVCQDKEGREVAAHGHCVSAKVCHADFCGGKPCETTGAGTPLATDKTPEQLRKEAAAYNELAANERNAYDEIKKSCGGACNAYDSRRLEQLESAYTQHEIDRDATKEQIAAIDQIKTYDAGPPPSAPMTLTDEGVEAYNVPLDKSLADNSVKLNPGLTPEQRADYDKPADAFGPAEHRIQDTFSRDGSTGPSEAVYEKTPDTTQQNLPLANGEWACTDCYNPSRDEVDKIVSDNRDAQIEALKTEKESAVASGDWTAEKEERLNDLETQKAEESKTAFCQNNVEPGCNRAPNEAATTRGIKSDVPLPQPRPEEKEVKSDVPLPKPRPEEKEVKSDVPLPKKRPEIKTGGSDDTPGPAKGGTSGPRPADCAGVSSGDCFDKKAAPANRQPPVDPNGNRVTTKGGEETKPPSSGGGTGSLMGALGSMLQGLMKALGAPQPQSAPAQACSTDPNIYAQQQQQYQQQLQQYNYQMQQYQYQQQLNQYYAERNGGYPPPMQPMPIQPTPCTPSTGSQCQAQPQQPPPSACSSGYWRATYSGACITGWDCIPGDGGSPRATLSCAPEIADVGMPITIAYGCSSGVASSSSFAITTQPSGTSIATMEAPPAGTNTATYTLACTESGKTTGAQCSVKIARSSVILVANPRTVASGETSLVSWLTTGMDKCTISSPDIPNFTAQNKAYTSVTGAAATPPLTSAARFHLECLTLTGSIKGATTTVSIAGVSDDFGGDLVEVSSTLGKTVSLGATTRITWRTINPPADSAISLWLIDLETNKPGKLIVGKKAGSGSYDWHLPGASDACPANSPYVCASDLVSGQQYAIEAHLYAPANADLGEPNTPAGTPEPTFLEFGSTDVFTME